MVRRAGAHFDPFWGCSNYPECRGSRGIVDGVALATEEEALLSIVKHIRRISAETS